MGKVFSDYYEYLKSTLHGDRENFDSFILYMPELFKLMNELLNDESLTAKERMMLCCGLGYFVTPKDIIPEQVFGAVGYVDDIFLCCHVLNIVHTNHGIELLRKYWHCDEDIKIVLSTSLSKSSDLVKQRKLENEILKYVGFME